MDPFTDLAIGQRCSIGKGRPESALQVIDSHLERNRIEFIAYSLAEF